MDVAPFPNSVNAPVPTVVDNKIHDSYRITQVSNIRTTKVAATTKYSEFVYEFRSGEVLTTTLKVSGQNLLDISA
jgi:hypothetical protein